MMRRTVTTMASMLLASAPATMLSACGGGERGGSAATSTTGAATTSSASAAAPGNTTGGAPRAVNPPVGATPQLLALGDSVFHGLAGGGLCHTCHGADAKGTALAPPLVSHKWITGDGSYQFIQQRVTQGVPNPTPPYTSPMLPKGGANLSDQQVKAVAAYVYAISHSGP